MPRVDELLDRLGRARYISTLDLTKGYWQVPLSDNAKPKTAFSTPSGHWQYRTLPFGLHGAPATFQRMMDILLRPHQAYAAAYLDDVVVHSVSWEDHVERLRRVLSELRRAGLTANPRKCHLALSEVKYLGFQVGRGLIRPQEKKVEAVRSAPRPTTKTQVRAFLGLAGYYRCFIPDFSSLAAPLTDLTRKGSRKRYSGHQRQRRPSRRSRRLSPPSPSSEPQILAAPSCCRRMPPTRDWEPSCHRCKKGRSIPSYISARSWPQPRETTPPWKKKPWPSSGQSWSCGTISSAGSSPWSRTTRPSSGWPAPRTPMPGWLVGSSRSRTSTSLCATAQGPRTPTPTASSRIWAAFAGLSGVTPHPPPNNPLLSHISNRTRTTLRGGECDERPDISSASPWKRRKNTCTSSSPADRSQLRLVSRWRYKPRGSHHEWVEPPAGLRLISLSLFSPCLCRQQPVNTSTSTRVGYRLLFFDTGAKSILLKRCRCRNGAWTDTCYIYTYMHTYIHTYIHTHTYCIWN